MKKFLCLLLAVIMLLGCLPAMAEDNPEWKINEFTGLVSRKSAAEKSESIIVPAEVNGIAVRGIEYMAFNMHKNFKQLTIADSAVMLDRRVLRDLLKLEALDLPENLLIIREGNFTNLPKLTSVVIPASVALVHSSFNKCASLTSITFEGMCPVFVTEGSFGMFTDLPADCVIYVPNNQVSAYKAAFADREDVVARIQPSGKNAERIEWFTSESDFIFDASTGTITGYTGTDSYLEIPATIDGVQVKHIADFAFEANVCCIIIPEGVETVGRYSLGSELLSYVSLPATLTNVGAGAFSSSYLSAISYPAAAVPAYEAAAFEGIKSDAWQLILPYGTSQEQVDAFAAYLTSSAPKGVVKASVIEPYSFPQLDAEAGAPFVGNWNAVAMTDGIDFFGMDVLGMSVTVLLHEDGTGIVDLDGDMVPGGWYVEDGVAVFAPILEEGGQPDPMEALPLTLDENGRMNLDLEGLILLLEMEGTVYEAPVIPEKSWPDFSLDDVKYFVGSWEAISYVMGDETYDAALIGPMVLTLNDDGTATSVEEGEEPYALTWCQGDYYGTALVGETYNSAAQLSFEGIDNIKMEQDGVTIILAPYTAAKLIEDADHLLGDWYDDFDNKLTLSNDGILTHTYSFDGWTDEYAWDVVDGVAVVTEGPWSGLPIVLENGILIITNDEGIFQIFSRDGDLSAYYGDDDDDYDMPEVQPIGADGEPYFGAWKADMYGMEVILYLNPDGTCAMEMMGEAEPGVWSIVEGKANIMGDELYIDGDGNLVYDAMFMVFTKAGDAPAPAVGTGIDYVPSAADDFIGGWICTADPNMQILLLEDEANLIDGGELFTTTWSLVDGVAEFDGMKLYITENYSVGILDMYGEQVEFERGYVEKPKASATAPETDGDDEMSDEELLALLALLAQLENGEGSSELAEELQPYVGTWHMVYIATGGFEGDLRSMGVTGQLELKADGTGVLSGAADDSGKWYDDEGQVRFGEAETPLTLLDDSFLRYGSQLAGYMIFSQDANAVWNPAPAVTEAPVAPVAPAAPSISFDSYEDYMEIKFVATTYTSFGTTVDASTLGAEYAVTFHANGTCEFVMSGMSTPSLTWGLQEVAMGLTKIEAFVINYYGTAYNFIPTETGFDMDFYGTMNLHFVPAQ